MSTHIHIYTHRCIRTYIFIHCPGYLESACRCVCVYVCVWSWMLLRIQPACQLPVSAKMHSYVHSWQVLQYNTVCYSMLPCVIRVRFVITLWHHIFLYLMRQILLAHTATLSNTYHAGICKACMYFACVSWCGCIRRCAKSSCVFVWMYVCLCVNVCVSLCECMSVFVWMYVCLCVNVCVSLCEYVFVFVWMSVCLCVNVCVPMKVNVLASVSIYMCVSMEVWMPACASVSMRMGLYRCARVHVYACLSMHA